jgi:hypothetical protein
MQVPAHLQQIESETEPQGGSTSEGRLTAASK